MHPLDTHFRSQVATLRPELVEGASTGSGHIGWGWPLFEAQATALTAPVAALARHLTTLGAGLLARPDRSVSAVPMLPTDETATLLAWGRGPGA